MVNLTKVEITFHTSSTQNKQPQYTVMFNNKASRNQFFDYVFTKNYQ